MRRNSCCSAYKIAPATALTSKAGWVIGPHIDIFPVARSFRATENEKKNEGASGEAAAIVRYTNSHWRDIFSFRLDWIEPRKRCTVHSGVDAWCPANPGAYLTELYGANYSSTAEALSNSYTYGSRREEGA